jgi:hypothetical protein
MTDPTFDQTNVDSQATPAEPVGPQDFDFDAYAEYESSLLERCRTFWAAESGVLVYRRMRVAEVFSYGCKDMKTSLQSQLGALHKSMRFKADVPNFLEAWYGIGTVASSFGLEYIWRQGQAPALRPKFGSASDALDYPVTPVAETPIGKHTLKMLDYFADKTGGCLPMSLTDTQSPLDVACNILSMDGLFIDMYDHPEAVKRLLDRIVDLLVEFTHEQLARLSDTVVWPGHGFASARCFQGLGISDDNALMLSDKHYLQFAASANEQAGEPFGGLGFHCCGNWSSKIHAVKQIAGLRMADGAFSTATDPSPNPPEPFARAFADTGIAVNARIVGGPETIADVVSRLWKRGMKLIVVTYCRTPEEQAEAYDRIHQICEV